ncbi:MAG TPA: hypothetical protein VKO85_09000 [Wenzhouxiangellaceae bacterium]|nr:hypothetical protein [Wenzhouxiangellaceae bacterium]
MKHVRDQNWFAVSLDFLIVVVGVFIGIQVANWNEERAEDDLADRYRVQLMEDIRSDIADIDVGYRTSEWRLAALTELLERAGAPTLDTTYLPERELTLPRPAVENDSITYLMNASTYTRFLDNDQPTYASLVNAGNARLIGRLKPWPCIHSYYAQHQEVRQAEDRLLLFRTELAGAQHDAGISHAGHLPAAETIDRMASDARLLAAMSSNRLWVFYHLVVLEELRNQALLLLEALEANSARCEFDEDSL